MNNSPDILCIGSVLWDVIGRSTRDMRVGSDVPGRIRRLPGGVAMNIAMTLRTFGMTPAILTAIGQDREGEELIAEALTMGLMCDYVYRSEDLPTDVYMAIEGASGLIAAIADAHSLEAAGDKILGASFSDALCEPRRGRLAMWHHVRRFRKCGLWSGCARCVPRVGHGRCCSGIRCK